MAFLFVSDAHLCERNLKKHRKMTGDSIYSFAQVIDLCIEHSADLVLGGDVFDKARPEPSTVVNFCTATSRLSELGLKLFFVQGQHDASDVSWTSVHPQAQSLDQQKFHVTAGPEKYSITGLNWRPSDQTQKLLKDIVPTDIFVGHQVWKDYNYGVAEVAFSDINEQATLLLVGDYHKMMVSTVGSRTAYSTGSLSMMSIDEEEQKQVLLFVDGLCSPTWKILKTRPVSRIMILSKDQLDEVMASQHVFKETYEPFDRPILEVRYSPDINRCRERLTAAFGQDTYLWLMPIPKKENGKVEVFRGLESLVSIPEAVASLLDSKDQPLAMRLWNAGDVNEELERIAEDV